MRINHNVAAMNTYRSYSSNAATANKSMEKLSSGTRINRAADDAAGLSISEKMRSQIRGLQQATRNTEDGVSFLQTAEGALNEVSDMLTRIKELAVQVKNGTYSADDKVNIGSEMAALGTAICDIYTETKFNGISVFGDQDDSGTAGVLDEVTTAAAGTAATIAYGEDGGQSIAIKQAVTVEMNDLLTQTVAAKTTPGGVIVADVEAAITEVNTLRAGYGAQQNQLEHVTNNMATTKENLQSAESRVRDVDMAEEMTEYTKNNILLQAAQSMLAQANSQPQGVLQLLQ